MGRTNKQSLQREIFARPVWSDLRASFLGSPLMNRVLSLVTCWLNVSLRGGPAPSFSFSTVCPHSGDFFNRDLVCMDSGSVCVCVCVCVYVCELLCVSAYVYVYVCVSAFVCVY